MSRWDELSMAEKAEMIGVAVKNGITTLPEIRAKYNEFAEGGSTDADLVDRIIKEEGFNTKPEDIGDGKITLGSGLTAQKWHDLYKQRGNKWSNADNRRAVAEEVANRRRWAEKNIPNWDKLPDSSQKALLSYKYNYDFNRNNSPKLFDALEKGDLYEAARQMDATSKDTNFKRGLQARRQREQKWFLSDVASKPVVPTIPFEQPVSTVVFNPYAEQIESTRIAPIMIPDEDSYVTAHRLTEAEERKQKFQERMEALSNFNRLLQITSLDNTAVPTFMPTTGNTFLNNIMGLTRAEGGKIHIAPSKKGTFTAAASKHGKSVQEFASQVLAHKENYSPAMVKKANFARNAAKWKHENGGNLFDGKENHSSQMNISPNIFRRPNGEYFYQASPDSEEVSVTPLNTLFDNPALWTYTDNNGKLYTPRQSATSTQGTIAKKEEEGPIVEAAKNYLGELQYDINNGVPIGGKYTMPAIAASALLPLAEAFAGTTLAGISAPIWADAALTSGFGAHGLQSLANGTADWSTALEIAPLGRLTRPVLKEAASAAENYRYPFGRPQIPENFLTIKPQVRTRVGDVEINNPQVAYRQGGNGIVEDFINSGKVRTKENQDIVDTGKGFTFDFGHEYSEPMFAQGRLNWGLPVGSNAQNTGLLTTSELLGVGNRQSRLVDNVVNGTTDIRMFPTRGRGVTGRVPLSEDQLNTVNTTAYNWEPGYGYRKVTKDLPALSWEDADNIANSELDWSAKSWFEDAAKRPFDDGTPYAYTTDDVVELLSHVPEYSKIERIAKQNGTWLKMPDGSTWTGDPRSWVQLQSKAVNDYNKDVFWSGRQHAFNPEYTGDVWGIRGRGKIPGLQARTYTNYDKDVLPLISEDVPIVDYNVHGDPWYNLWKERVTTNDVVNRDFSEGAKRVHIDNVRDSGPNLIPYSSIFRTGDKMLDIQLLGSPQNDVIIAPNVVRKSLVGNNGAFNKSISNAFRELLPLGLGYSTYNHINSSNNGL